MKITEIVWEDGKKYKDEFGYIWEVDVKRNSLFNTIYGVEECIVNLYRLFEIINFEFEEVIDWSQVEVDTKVTVWNTDFPSFKRKRYFAKYENGLIYVFGDGRTSWNAFDENDLTAWDCGELAE